ncbi:MAG: hypothetical protein RIB93_28705 [Coleofasciculus sp. D1-CHI-01]|uniref:hypothetical protein n=1 Tax=Coleofasciculus sp. D1-CHI-01 TaxID=3068482 RepID=UPI0032F96493
MRSPVFLRDGRATQPSVGAGFTDTILFKTGNLCKPALFLELFMSARGSPLPDPRCFGSSLTGAIASGGDSYLTKFHPGSFPLANTTGKSINFLEEPESFVNPDSMVTWWVTADLLLNGLFPQFNTA